MEAEFTRLGTVLEPNDSAEGREDVLNPASARLRDGTLHLYPRMVAPGNVSRIGSFRVVQDSDSAFVARRAGTVLQPEAPYELRDLPGGYGCEDPRVTFIAALDAYVMAYVAFGPRGPEVALAVSRDGLSWERLGLMCFRGSEAPFADKDAAFFPEPVRSPGGVMSLAFYHRPTLNVSVREGQHALAALKALPPEKREGIAIGYVPLDAARRDIRGLCNVAETHRVSLPPADWGRIKVGAGTPPVRVREGWLSAIHGVDEVADPTASALLRYCCGIIVHDLERLDRVVYRSQSPLFVAELPDEIEGAVGYVVFPTAIDPRGDRTFDIYYGMADDRVGRGRLTLKT